MVRTVTAGLDGSRESRAAAEWAAREAGLLGLPLRLVHVWEPVPEPIAQAPLLGVETQQHWTERIPREAAEGIRLRHPGVDVSIGQLSGRPADELLRAAKDAELLVLGSRGLSGIGGFMVGSVGLSVVAHADRPVVLVRADQQAADEHETDPAGIPSAATPFRPVVLGLDTDSPDEELISFAFAAAVRRGTSLRVVHGWNPPPYYAYGLAVDLERHGALARRETGALAEVLVPWRKEFPDTEVVEESFYGTPANHLVDASREASLVVVGRRVRRRALGTHIGPVTHAVLHHSIAPVAVVPHN
ncbi:nucleotide-binding universal stress UspA family protein [Streptomyces sp. SAI-208]|uniref:universal stress protein n=1 Tax=unclassified Streptomyces TaxID=2593676 RepID=UPI002476E326|nr:MULTISPECIES: universal stress protein [unclassified Streptomyces]MDH6520619.1 nucleotide-binding universal stress UspA family protein [Streptomyces sp. SAI-090]MDH6552836.1 nucleotide-binding universal stress UspA family protein [Streptomyces sp. SAI-041]MDH6571923.1 nucleotide-binding universal stress UspA family protein [Streptomyces sp. SAI-117]MDH6583118.1 nucleotide-binding universal stress UspA family protein [Streptomyces sp. SAI-133]MDH6611604.1 nucleotide-binding universal stress 